MWRDEVPSGGALHWVRRQYRDTGREQGVTGWFDRELLPFLRWLDPNLSDLLVRLAPSLIIRGETELLGLAYPRFGIRVRTGCGSLMNLRRTCDMIRAIYERNPLDAEQLVRDIRSGSCIADCLLSEREAKAQGFRLITCDLGEAFGEEEPLPGVPFVKHTELGGGMCVQACYCMASYLLHDLVRPVCGIAETTMEARSRWLTTSHGGIGVCSVDIGGLTPFDIRSVVEDGGSNGLSVHLASITNPGPLAAGSSLTALSSLRATSFIRSHIESGWPMIAYVSMSRMYGDHHLHFAERKFDRDVTVMLSHAERERYLKQVGASRIRNRIELSRLGPVDRRQEQTQQHAVLIVGSSVTSVGSSPADHEFLINDPATLPFLKATTADLYECRQYRPEAEGGALTEDQLGPLHLQYFLPTAVKVPLDLQDSTDGSMSIRDVAFCFSHLSRTASFPVPDVAFSSDDFNKAKSYLCQCRLMRSGLRLLTRTGIDVTGALTGPESVHEGHWYWVQSLRGLHGPLALIWRTDRVLERGTPIHQYLVGVCTTRAFWTTESLLGHT